MPFEHTRMPCAVWSALFTRHIAILHNFNICWYLLINDYPSFCLVCFNLTSHGAFYSWTKFYLVNPFSTDVFCFIDLSERHCRQCDKLASKKRKHTFIRLHIWVMGHTIMSTSEKKKEKRTAIYRKLTVSGLIVVSNGIQIEQPISPDGPMQNKCHR